jgi:hypothetical protein
MGTAIFRRFSGDMEELLAGLLSAIFEILGEAIFECICAAIIALIWRPIQNAFEESEEVSPVLAAAGYLLLGFVCGGVSVYVFPHHLIHPSKIHGISHLISPVLTGLVMAQMGLLRRRKDQRVVRIESFWYGFTFAFGIALVRFLFVM